MISIKWQKYLGLTVNMKLNKWEGLYLWKMTEEKIWLITLDNDFIIPSTGIKINALTLEGDSIVLYYNLEIYEAFIQGIYSKIISNNDTLLVYKIILNEQKNYYYDSSHLASTIILNYAIDYNPYL